MARQRWIERNEVAEYIIDAYAGTEELPRLQGGMIKRRVFLWDHNGQVVMGNIQAFAEHLIDKFTLVVTVPSASSTVNAFLIEMGERIKRGYKDYRMSGEFNGKYQSPEPESWVL